MKKVTLEQQAAYLQFLSAATVTLRRGMVLIEISPPVEREDMRWRVRRLHLLDESQEEWFPTWEAALDYAIK